MPGIFYQVVTPVLLILALAGCQANPMLSSSRVSGPLTGTPDPAATVSPTRPMQAATTAPEMTRTATSSATVTPAQTPAASPALTATMDPAAVRETFEGPQASWKAVVETRGNGAVKPSRSTVFAGNYAAQVSSSGAGSPAMVRAADFNDAAASHTWGERPGTWFWQSAMLYVPSATVNALGSSGFLTIAGFWPGSGGPYGWWLRLRRDHQGYAALYVDGYDLDKKPAEFNIYGQMPLDRWVDVAIGLHSQNGPGVKRSFAVVIDGNFYGWYHQGNMENETFDHAAMGILDTNVSAPLDVFIDQWSVPGRQLFPPGPDNRPTAALQTQDFRTAQGAQWQIDWSTWANALVLDPTYGLYSDSWRLQSGRNLDRMPDLTSGWAEIVVDWPKGVPPGNSALNGAFAGLIGFHKEINREQNLEVSPMIVDGTAKLVYDAWVGAEHDLAAWTLPSATQLTDGRNIPEPGDILRVRWEKVGPTRLHVQVSYYDASTVTWYPNVIDDTHDLSAIPSQDTSLPGPVNYLDGYHQAASITIDTQYYSIRRFTVGTLETYPSR